MTPFELLLAEARDLSTLGHPAEALERLAPLWSELERRRRVSRRGASGSGTAGGGSASVVSSHARSQAVSRGDRESGRVALRFEVGVLIGRQHVGLGDAYAARAVLDGLLRDAEDEALDHRMVARAWLLRAMAAYLMNDGDHAWTLIGWLVETSGSAEAVAGGLYLKAAISGVVLGDAEQAAALREQVIEQFAGSDEVEVCESVALSLLEQAKEFMNRDELATSLGLLDMLVSRYPEVAAPLWPWLQLERALTRGRVLSRLGDYSRAVTELDEMLRAASQWSGEAVASLCAEALSDKAWTLREGGRVRESLDVYDELIERFTASTGDVQRSCVARAHYAKAAVFRDLGRDADELAAWTALIEGFEDDPPPQDPRLVAYGVSERARTLARLGRWDEAVADIDRIVARYTGDPDLTVMRQSAIALAQTARWWPARSDPVPALAALEAMLVRLDALNDAAAPGALAFALNARLAILAHSGRVAEAVLVGEQLADHLHPDDPIETMQDNAWCLYDAAETATDLGQLEPACRWYEALIELFDETDDPKIQRTAARAAAARTVCLHELGRDDEYQVTDLLRFGALMLPIIDESIKGADGPGSTARAATADLYLIRALLLAQLDRTTEARQQLKQLINQFKRDTDPTVKQTVHLAREVRAELE